MNSKKLINSFSAVFSLLLLALSENSGARGLVTIDNGNMKVNGTYIWVSNRKPIDNAPWGNDQTTYLQNVQPQDNITIRVSGKNPTKRYVFFANIDHDDFDVSDRVTLNMAENSSLISSLFGSSNLLSDSRLGEVIINASEGTSLFTLKIIGGATDRFASNSNIVRIEGPVRITGLGKDQNETATIEILGGKGINADGNYLFIRNATLDLANSSRYSLVAGAHVSSPSEVAIAKDNIVDIRDVPKLHATAVYGAYSTGTSKNNSLEITNSSVIALVGGGYAKLGAADSNTLNITSSEITGDTFGGVSQNGNASGNTVNLISGRILGNVWGGLSITGIASDNLINIDSKHEDLDLSKAFLYGGNGPSNRLSVTSWYGDVSGIEKFKKIELNQVIWRPSQTVLNVTQTFSDKDSTDIEVVTHQEDGQQYFDVVTGNEKPDGYMYLLKTDSAAAISYEITQRGWIQDSPLTKKAAGVLKLNNGVVMVVKPEEETPPEEDTPLLPPSVIPDVPVEDVFPDNQPAKSPNKQIDIVNDSREASAMMINDSSLFSLETMGSLKADENEGIQTFAGLKGTVSRYRGHSDIRVKTAYFLAGLGDKKKLETGFISWGLFVEAGLGNYKTDSHFLGIRLKGNGHANYQGVGGAIKYEHDSGAYAEAMIRFGRLKNELKNGIIDEGRKPLSYDHSSLYVNTLVGGGYQWHLTEKSSLTLGARYLYGHIDGETRSIGKNRYHFANINSHRVQLLIRGTHSIGSAMLKAQLVGEREFSGKTKNRVDGIATPGRGLSGNTVLAGIGADFQASKSLQFNSLLQASVGKRRSVAGGIRAFYSW